jgi:hypothetical protein
LNPLKKNFFTSELGRNWTHVSNHAQGKAASNQSVGSKQEGSAIPSVGIIITTTTTTVMTMALVAVAVAVAACGAGVYLVAVHVEQELRGLPVHLLPREIRHLQPHSPPHARLAG